MSVPLLLGLSLCILVVAVLYSSVGHGGASGYIAILALFSLAPAAFKPTALVLNILVSAIATFNFSRAGHFSWRLFWPFAATSIPFSFLGGYLRLPTHVYQPLVGIVLLASACRLFPRKEERFQALSS
ncbi:MAG TPA: sulfite exporter TauE/SafE family protein [Patescibacteria group bacterium]|nr:sulfite exporter TauE/SafE family protein [Patescibacteria group bacterium]